MWKPRQTMKHRIYKQVRLNILNSKLILQSDNNQTAEMSEIIYAYSSYRYIPRDLLNERCKLIKMWQYRWIQHWYLKPTLKKSRHLAVNKFNCTMMFTISKFQIHYVNWKYKYWRKFCPLRRTTVDKLLIIHLQNNY